MSEEAENPSRAEEDFLRHVQEVQQLLTRHRLVEDLVHRQEMPRHGLVENLVQKQNLSELTKKLAAMETAEVARILEALPHNESLVAWELVREERGEAILDELDDALRETLSSLSQQPKRQIMLNAFELHNGRLRQILVESKELLAATTPIWIDLIAPGVEEREWIKEIFDLSLPEQRMLNRRKVATETGVMPIVRR